MMPKADATSTPIDVSVPVKVYAVRLRLLSPALGTRPRDPELLKRWLEADEKRGKVPLFGEEEAELAAEAQRADETLRHWTTFPAEDDGDIYLFNYQILGWLKERALEHAANLGIPALRSKIQRYVYIVPRKIYLGLNQDDLDYLERPLRASTRYGDVVSIIRSDVVPAGTRISFEMHVLNNKAGVDDRLLWNLLRMGIYRGLLQWRNAGHGRFAVEQFSLTQGSSFPVEEW